MRRRLWLALARVLILFLADCAIADSRGEAIASKLKASLPKSWVVIERRICVLPEGHYRGQTYDGERGEEILLQGVADVRVSWQATGGDWRSEIVGKEALRIYVMPPAYRQSPWRFFIPQRPVAAGLLSETESHKIYAYPSFIIVEKERLELIVKQAKAIRWPDSPERTGTLSWGSWRADILRLLN